MTKEEAITRLKNMAWLYGSVEREQNLEAIDMAIEALTYQNLSKPNNTCEVDLISREDAMSAVQDHFNADGFQGYYDGQKMMDRITALPSAEAVQGEWILDGGTPICSGCHEEPCWSSEGYDFTDFCPNCGADMRGDKE